MTDSVGVLSKAEMIRTLATALKSKGFRKKRAYWYKNIGEYLMCVNVQGSQWDSNDYYVNIGMAEYNAKNEPVLLEWLWSHRCRGINGERNISLEEALANVEKYMNDYLMDSDISAFLRRNSATIVGRQYWL